MTQAMQHQAIDKRARQRIRQQIVHPNANLLPLLRQADWSNDLAPVLDIEGESFNHPWSFDKFVDFINKPNSSATIATIAGRVVGYMLIERERTNEVTGEGSGERLHIAHIAVSPAHRGNGTGSTMVNSLEGNTVTLNLRRSNTKAQRLYYELGFKIVRTLPQHYADGEDGFFMSSAVA
ncbi:MAG: GNAT family N-acetyltransferase [Candidatus Obscuribacterales bacterium]|jgi:ribosomal-protein-alanine N-acetyltransferase